MVLKSPLILCVVAFFTACTSTPEQLAQIEHVAIPSHFDGWKIVSREVPLFSDSNVRNYVPITEQSTNHNEWSKIIHIDYDSGNSDIPTVSTRRQKQLMAGKCKKTTLTVLRRTEYSVLYETQSSNCTNAKDQHSISRYILGEDGLHQITYLEKVTTLSSDTRSEWVNMLSRAYLVINGQRLAHIN